MPESNQRVIDLSCEACLREDHEDCHVTTYDEAQDNWSPCMCRCGGGLEAWRQATP